MRKVARLLPDALARREVLATARAQQTLRRWSEVVGEDLASRSQPDRYERGTVWVATTGSAWAQELRMMKDRILARLREMSGEEDLFREVRFGVRPIVKTHPAAPPATSAAPDDRQGMTIREIADRRLKNWPHENRDRA